jgi:hypothetical protein
VAEAHLDHPGEITWYAGHGPQPVLGDCDHACAHHLQAVIAWGPSLDRYELVRCDVPYGCNRTCRAWANGHGRITTPWLNVAVPATAVRH